MKFKLRFYSAVLLFAFAQFAVAGDEVMIPTKETLAASVVRGEIVFMSYCTLCHGVSGEGNGRAAKIYNPRPANLRKSMFPDAYKEGIIRVGGERMGRSSAMPSWQDELTEEQIHDVVNYLRTIAPADADR